MSGDMEAAYYRICADAERRLAQKTDGRANALLHLQLADAYDQRLHDLIVRERIAKAMGEHADEVLPN